MRSLLSLLKNWLGPMPMANRVVPGTLAISRAKLSIACAGAQVISSVVLGSKCFTYSRITSKIGRQAIFLPSLRVTSTAPSRSGSATGENFPT